MSGTRWSWLRSSVVLSGLAGLLVAAAVAAQEPPPRDDDLLDQARRRAEVAAQKVESDVRAALREAGRLATSDPAAAQERLKKALALLTDDTSLPAERRATLRHLVKERLRLTEADAATAARQAERTERQFQIVGRRAEEQRRQTDQDSLERGLATVNSLRQDGKVDEANRLAAELAQRYPNSPAAQASSRIAGTTDQLAGGRRFQSERERNLTATFRDAERSATPPAGDLDFPKDWRERTKNRSATVQLTAKEKAILQALNAPISVDFKNRRFEDVINYLQDVTGQPILLDKVALDDAGVNYDSPVTVHVNGVALRTLLRKVLAEFGLAYVVKEQTLQVTSAVRARDMMVVRSYYIGDILAGMSGPWSTAPFPFNQPSALQTVQNINQLIEMVQSSVDPQSWKSKGGEGTITYHPGSMSLVIKQSAEVHAMLAGSLMR